MNWEIIAVALIASLVSPSVLSWMTTNARRKDRQADWDRQDKVAADVREAARLVVIAKDELAKTSAATNSKLDVIHTLVNGDVTAAIQDSLNSVVRELAALTKLRESRRAVGKKPSQETSAAIARAEAKIAELRATINARKTRAALAEAAK